MAKNDEIRLYLVYMRHRILSDKKWVKCKVGPYPVSAASAKKAATLFLRHLANNGGVPQHYGNCAVYVCQHVWDGKPGFKIATHTDGDIRFDVRFDGEFYAKLSEKSWASE